MPRKQKPPGFEKWTWEEIRCGRKLSKTEKRGRKFAKSFGATEKPNGDLLHTPESFLAVAVLFIVIVGMALLVECSKS